MNGSDAALPGERVAPGRFLGLLVQLGVLVLIVRLFSLENPLFYDKIMPLALGGFVVHYFLPRRHRLPFFIVLSLAGIYAGLGLAGSLWLVGIGLALIAACHLPVHWGARAGLVGAIGAGLALLRSGRVEVSWAASVVPVLASMFMFRIVIYLYDLEHQKDKPSLQHGLAYFFLLPNVVFPLFPIVDYATFRRGDHDGDRHQVAQRGLHWMLWGVIELLLYRYVNHYWLIAREEVIGLDTLAQYAAANYLLILRVLGQFNLAVGILLLFGFNLPPVTDRFFLAPGFTDFWRRANIYWKDMMQKVFFYPLYFRLRGLKPTPRLVVSMAIVFVVTWFLHSYQWFWIRGSFLLSAPDVLFWTIFGVLVTLNALHETTRRRAKPGAAPGSLRELASRAVRALGLFALIAFLWSLWTSPSVSDWLDLWFATEITFAEVVRFVPVVVAAFVAMLAAVFLLEGREQLAAGQGKTRVSGLVFLRPAAVSALSLALLVLLGTPGATSQLNGKAAGVVNSLRGGRLSPRETELMTRGYYEDLNAANQFNNALSNTQLYEIYNKKGEDWPPFRQTRAARVTDSFVREEIVPSVSIDFHGAPLSTNRWAMRDKEYELEKPEGVYRIALLGASIPFGSGVANEETMEAVLEERLNREHGGKRYARYEVLNFSVPGWAPPQHLVLLETKVLSFEPDAVFFIANRREDIASARHIANAVGRGVPMPFDFLERVVVKARVDRNTRFEEAFRRLRRYGEQMIEDIYPRFAKSCRAKGALPVYVYTPTVKEAAEAGDPETDPRFVRMAEKAGFVVIDAVDAWDGVDLSTLQVRPWDWHPNARGHRLLADRVFEQLEQHDERLGLKLFLARR